MLNKQKVLDFAKEGYSYAQIASKLGVTYSVVWKVLKGENVVCTLKETQPKRKPCSELHTRIGVRISSLMTDKGIELKPLSVYTGLHISVLRRALYGAQDLRVSDLEKIATALNVKITKLLE